MARPLPLAYHSLTLAVPSLSETSQVFRNVSSALDTPANFQRMDWCRKGVRGDLISCASMRMSGLMPYCHPRRIEEFEPGSDRLEPLRRN